MNALADLDCRKLGPDATAMPANEVETWNAAVPHWSVVEADGVPRLERVFRFPNFAQALMFTNAVALMAEQQDHHPALLTEWGRVTVQWWTHKVRGLHFNDFVAAAKCDRIYDSISGRKKTP